MKVGSGYGSIVMAGGCLAKVQVGSWKQCSTNQSDGWPEDTNIPVGWILTRYQTYLILPEVDVVTGSGGMVKEEECLPTGWKQCSSVCEPVPALDELTLSLSAAL